MIKFEETLKLGQLLQPGDIFHLLRKERVPSGAGKLAAALFPQTAWYTEGVLKLAQQSAQAAPAITPKADSEKDRAIESFKSFAQKKLEETTGGKISFTGGEVALQEGASVGRKLQVKSGNLPEWSSEDLEVIFYGEASKLGKDANDQRASELLQKMISAMRIETNKVVSVLTESDLTEELARGVFHSRPKFVVSLGAVATNNLLGRKEKLTRVHGQFFPLKLESNGELFECQLMPLFHPDFLLINPNMKRTAWIDLQKIMSELGISIA